MMDIEQELLRFSEFREVYLKLEDENYLLQCQQLGGMFSWKPTPDAVIIKKYMKLYYDNDKR